MKKDNLVYVQDIFDCIGQINEYIGNTDKVTFVNSGMLKDAVIRQFEIIGEASSRLKADFKNKYPDIPWQKTKDLRNLLIHDYDGVDVESLWDFYKNDLPDLKSKIEKLLN